MRYLGKMHIGSNQSGKGDNRRPDSRILDESLFLTSEQARKFNSDLGKGTHCFICKERIYLSKTFLVKNKVLVVGSCCKNFIYK